MSPGLLFQFAFKFFNHNRFFRYICTGFTTNRQISQVRIQGKNPLFINIRIFCAGGVWQYLGQNFIGLEAIREFFDQAATRLGGQRLLTRKKIHARQYDFKINPVWLFCQTNTRFSNSLLVKIAARIHSDQCATSQPNFSRNNTIAAAIQSL